MLIFDTKMIFNLMCCCRMLKSNFFDILNFTKTIEINNLNPAKTVGQLGSVDGK